MKSNEKGLLLYHMQMWRNDAGFIKKKKMLRLRQGQRRLALHFMQLSPDIKVGSEYDLQPIEGSLHQETSMFPIHVNVNFTWPQKSQTLTERKK